MAETIFARIRILEQENRQLRQELALTQTERDEWKNKAVEISHMLTYTAEKLNHRGLEVVK